jgi:hypothetical protein
MSYDDDDDDDDDDDNDATRFGVSFFFSFDALRIHSISSPLSLMYCALYLCNHLRRYGLRSTLAARLVRRVCVKPDPLDYDDNGYEFRAIRRDASRRCWLRVVVAKVANASLRNTGRNWRTGGCGGGLNHGCWVGTTWLAGWLLHLPHLHFNY